ncbi:hypothetical protein [Fodinicurvata sediminis]|uniref:hypothetical protein n=1 Tax=Fodinicurvata sediminis TaxID=1121832 RepID=UPI0003B76B0F|nr:hypothetical protein [Fodinicurvata sediminis]
MRQSSAHVIIRHVKAASRWHPHIVTLLIAIFLLGQTADVRAEDYKDAVDGMADLLAHEEVDDPRIKERRWRALEARASGRDRGSAMYITPNHSRFDMMTVNLRSMVSYSLPSKWLDIRDGGDRILKRIADWGDAVAGEYETDPDGPFLPPFPPALADAMEKCAELGYVKRSEDGRKQRALCLYGQSVGKARLQFSSLVHKTVLERREFYLARFEGLRLEDQASEDTTELATLSPEQACTKTDGFAVCASCHKSFSQIAGGKSGRAMPCDRDDQIIALDVTVSYSKFAFNLSRMQDPRISLIFRKDNGEKYTLWYRVDGLMDALLAARN